jgi:tetratricopeptide (TPR) repeat protein
VTWLPAFKKLRQVLVDLYPTDEDAYQLAVTAGLKPGYIRFTGKAINTWTYILVDAYIRGKIADVIHAARSQYSSNTSLAEAEQVWLVHGSELQKQCLHLYRNAALALLLLLVLVLPSSTATSSWILTEALIILIPYTGQFKEAAFYPEHVIRDALQARVQALEREGYPIRLREWDQPISTAEEARELGERQHATLVIWGEFDDIVGVRTFIEIIPELPHLDVQRGGSFFTYSPYLLKQLTIDGNAVPSASEKQACLGEDFPSMADYAVLVSLGIVDLSRSSLESTGSVSLERCLRAEGLFSQAIEITEAPRTCPWRVDQASYWRGAVRMMQNRYLEAQADFKQSVQANPEFWPALAQLGSVNLTLELPAEEHLQAALDRIPEGDAANRVIVHSNLCLARIPQSAPEDILTCYNAIKADVEQESLPSEVQVLYLLHLGNWYYSQLDCDRAEQVYNEALTLLDANQSPEALAIFLENKGLAAICTEAYEQAAQHFARAQAIYEQHQLMVGRARVQIRIGMLDYLRGKSSAQSAFEVALVLAQQAASAYYQAWSYLGLGLTAKQNEDMKMACEHFHKALALLQNLSPSEASIVQQYMEASACGTVTEP